MTTTEDRAALRIAEPAPAPSSEPVDAAAPQRPRAGRLALILGAFVALGPLTIDMYLPALPTITSRAADDVGGGAADPDRHAAGPRARPAVLGPLSDALGRRRPLLAGTALHVVASLLVLVAPNVAILGALRVLQGVGAAAGAVIAIAVVRDLYDGRAAATMLSRLFLVLGAAPVLAPTIGGEILASPPGAACSRCWPPTAC